MLMRLGKSKKRMALLLAGVMLVGSFVLYNGDHRDKTAADSNSQAETGTDIYKAGEYDNCDEYGEDGLQQEMEATEYAQSDQSGHESGHGSPSTVTKQKMVISWDISIETEDFEDAMTKLDELMKTSGGYIEYQNEYSQYGSKYAYFTLRIPEEEGDRYVDSFDQIGTVISRSKSSCNVSLQYIDTESRLKSLKTERKTLHNILKKAESLSDVIELQGVLQDINYNIESYESQLRSLQNSVDYMTIEVSIQEVSREHVQNPGVWEEIKQTFTACISSILDYGRWILVTVLGYSPVIVFVFLVIIICRLRKRKKEKKGNTSDVE